MLCMGTPFWTLCVEVQATQSVEALVPTETVGTSYGDRGNELLSSF